MSGLQYDDEQDRGSRAQPDIAGSLYLGCRTYVVCKREAKRRPSIAPLGRAKGDCPRDYELDTVIERDIKSTVQAK